MVLSIYAEPAGLVGTVEPLRYKERSDPVPFSTPGMEPKFREPVLLVDMENAREALEVSPEYARHDYRRKINQHIETLGSRPAAPAWTTS
jgi:hypothetical protein